MKYASSATALALCLSLTGCAKHPTDPQDPYEPLNRNIYKFNNCIDHTLYRPVATVYHHVVPRVVRKGVTNFFYNLDAPMIFANDLLQGKVKYAGLDLARFLINSTLGIAGLLDPASKMGIPKHFNNFGNTLAYYSDNKKSPYLVVPFLGPRTFRDTFAIPFDVAAFPPTYMTQDWIFYSLTALYYVNLRSRLLEYDKFLDTAFDPYAAMRNAYLSQRNKNIDIVVNGGDYKRGKSQEAQDIEDILHSSAPSSTQEEAADEFTFDKMPSKK